MRSRAAARSAAAAKSLVSLDEGDALAIAHERGDELVALDEALARLQAMNERQARIVECRFYGGMSVEETAEALGRVARRPSSANGRRRAPG